MATDSRRSRSNTSMSTRSNRPLSRASTTSVHSFEQYQPQPQQARPPHFSHQTQYNAAFTSEPLQPALLQAAQHASAQDNLMSMSLESVQQYLGYNSESTPQPTQSNGMSPPMDVHQYHTAMAPQSQQPSFMAPPMDDDKKKKVSASGSATNDKELRQLLAQNEGRHLKDVAAEVIQNDRTSKAEKSKQLFAMLW
jgi:regulatory factor X